MRKEENVFYNENCAFDAYLPPTNGFSTILYFHGGGFESGDKADETNIELAQSFVRAGYGFISANYRTYTSGARFPDFLEDGEFAFVKAVLPWLKKREGVLLYESARVAAQR